MCGGHALKDRQCPFTIESMKRLQTGRQSGHHDVGFRITINKPPDHVWIQKRHIAGHDKNALFVAFASPV